MNKIYLSTPTVETLAHNLAESLENIARQVVRPLFGENITPDSIIPEHRARKICGEHGYEAVFFKGTNQAKTIQESAIKNHQDYANGLREYFPKGCPTTTRLADAHENFARAISLADIEIARNERNPNSLGKTLKTLKDYHGNNARLYGKLSQNDPYNRKKANFHGKTSETINNAQKILTPNQNMGLN